jgi:hypothetical protein
VARSGVLTVVRLSAALLSVALLRLLRGASSSAGASSAAKAVVTKPLLLLLAVNCKPSAGSTALLTAKNCCQLTPEVVLLASPLTTTLPLQLLIQCLCRCRWHMASVRTCATARGLPVHC